MVKTTGEGWDVTVICAACSSSFTYLKSAPGRFRRSCSEECREARKRETASRFNAKARADGRYRDREKAHHAALQIAHTCKVCSASFTSNQYKATCCSPACLKLRKQGQRAAYADRERAAGRTTICPECTKPFYRGSPHGKCCSNVCTRRARDRIFGARRRGRYAEGEAVDPIKVFERDGWRCQECRRPTPRKLRGSTDPRAPELDHIVSVIDGGEHSYRNTQCLCRGCNGRKGGASRGQLVLM